MRASKNWGYNACRAMFRQVETLFFRLNKDTITLALVLPDTKRLEIEGTEEEWRGVRDKIDTLLGVKT